MGPSGPPLRDGGESVSRPGHAPGLKRCGKNAQGRLRGRCGSRHVLCKGGRGPLGRLWTGHQIDPNPYRHPKLAIGARSRLHENTCSLTATNQHIIGPLYADLFRRHEGLGQISRRKRGDEGQLRSFCGRTVGGHQQGGSQVAGPGLPAPSPSTPACGLMQRCNPPRAPLPGLGPAASFGIGGVELVVERDRRVSGSQIRPSRRRWLPPPQADQGTPTPPERRGR